MNDHDQDGENGSLENLQLSTDWEYVHCCVDDSSPIETRNPQAVNCLRGSAEEGASSLSLVADMRGFDSENLVSDIVGSLLSPDCCKKLFLKMLTEGGVNIVYMSIDRLYNSKRMGEFYALSMHEMFNRSKETM